MTASPGGRNPAPNILWIFCEDLSPWFGLYGDKTVPTPNIDALAKRGVLFRRCFSPAGVCSPARSGLITGCMPTSIGVHQHVSSRLAEPPVHLPEGIVPIPKLFREGGYFTFNGGKDDYNFVYDREELYHGNHRQIEFYGEHHVEFECKDTETRDWHYWRHRNEGQPFFGQFTLWAGKNQKTPPYRVDPATVPVPACYPDTEEIRRHCARHYEQILITDEEVGAITQALADDDLLDNTVIFFFSDHGYELLRHKQFLYDGGIHVPLIVAGLPPDLQTSEGSVRDDLCSSIDIAATSLKLAGLPVPPWMESRPLFDPDFHRDFVVATRDRCDFTIDRIRAIRTKRFKYLRNFLTDRPLLQPQYRDRHPVTREIHALREAGLLEEERFSWTHEERPAEELYDLDSDPGELINVAGRPEYAAELDAMRKRLDEWIATTGDRGQYPESDDQLRALLERWGTDRCVNPEYDRVR